MSGTLGAKHKHPKTHCKRGHEFTPEDTGSTGHSTRRCKACSAIRIKASRKLRNPTGKRITPRRIPGCHPERKHRAFGLCDLCYMKAWCKKYGAESKRRITYGLSPERYKQLYEEQGGMCKICKRRPISHTDHDHSTNRFRGLLCNLCNVGLGAFLDDPESLDSAAEYIRGSRANTIDQQGSGPTLLHACVASGSGGQTAIG